LSDVNRPFDGSPDAFAVHALLRGAQAVVHLNDVPLVQSGLRRVESSVHATPWIVDGLNTLRLEVVGSLRLEILPVGVSAIDREAGPVDAWCRVMAGHYADIVPDVERDETLAELAWSAGDASMRALPCTLEETFVTSARPRWAWQDAPRLDPESPSLRSRVLDEARRIHEGLARGDATPLIARMATLLRESAHFNLAPGALAAGMSNEIARFSAESDHAVAPIDDTTARLLPIAGGRVLRVLGEDGGPLLRAGPGVAEPWSFPLDFVEIDGNLEICRIG